MLNRGIYDKQGSTKTLLLIIILSFLIILISLSVFLIINYFSKTSSQINEINDSGKINSGFEGENKIITNCGTDFQCFKDMVENCGLANAILSFEGNLTIYNVENYSESVTTYLNLTYLMEIQGMASDKCIYNEEEKNMGTNMTCEFDSGELELYLKDKENNINKLFKGNLSNQEYFGDASFDFSCDLGTPFSICTYKEDWGTYECGVYNSN